MTRPLLLIAEGLFSKFGFNDGDAVSEWWWDEFDDAPPRIDEHAVLRELVRTHLLPLIPGEFTVYEVETTHNPIRVETWRGQDWDCYSLDTPPDLGEIAVAIPPGVVIAAIRRAEGATTMADEQVSSTITIPPSAIATSTAVATITIRPDFTGWQKAFAQASADLELAAQAIGEGIRRFFAGAGLSPAPRRHSSSLSAAYRRRHVRNRRRRSR